LVWWIILSLLTFTILDRLTKPRLYIREIELRNMSFMEIITIYMPIPIVLPLLEAEILMVFGVAYFWSINKILWGVDSHPRV